MNMKLQDNVQIYEVFARQRRHEPLQQIGTVTAANSDLAAAYAQSIYNEEPWIEMIVIARVDLIPAISLEESAA
jgi:1,2-phenylacetyl-CoA epoxidase PaaB subunit